MKEKAALSMVHRRSAATIGNPLPQREAKPLSAVTKTLPKRTIRLTDRERDLVEFAVDGI